MRFNKTLVIVTGLAGNSEFFSPDLSVLRGEAVWGFGEKIVAVSLGASH